MKLQEISDAYNSRYKEIYDRIDKNMDKIEYILNAECNLDEWYFNSEDKSMITIHAYTKGWGGDRDDESWNDIECKYLENDEVFEKWLYSEYEKKKAEDAAKDVNDSKFQEKFERNLYEKLKKKYEE